MPVSQPEDPPAPLATPPTAPPRSSARRSSALATSRATTHRSRAKPIVRTLMAVAMTLIGIAHFVAPAPFLRIMPSALPYPLALIYISGGFEILGGLGLLHARLQQPAAWGLMLLFVAIFPANIHMALHEIQPMPGGAMPVWTMWARLPFQFALIAVAYWFTRGSESDDFRQR